MRRRFPASAPAGGIVPGQEEYHAHGVVPPGDYPPTPRQAALMAEYDGQEWGDAL